jgi:hypothetical protein
MKIETDKTSAKAIFAVIYISLSSPFVLAVNFSIVWMQLVEDGSWNSLKLPAVYVPVYFFSGILLAIIFIYLQMLIERKKEFSNYALRIFSCYFPYALFLPYNFMLAFGDIEHNIAGFIFLPFYFLYLIMAMPFSLLCRFRKWKIQEREIK